MRSTMANRKTNWSYTSLAIILIVITVVESIRGGILKNVGDGEVTEPIALDRRQVVNATVGAPSPSSSADQQSSAAPVTTTVTNRQTTTAVAVVPQPSSDNSGGSGGGDNTSPSASPGGGSSSSDGTTAAAAAAVPVATGGSNSGSGSSGDSNSGQPVSNADSGSTTGGDSNGGSSDTSSGSSGGLSGDTSGDASSGSSNGAAAAGSGSDDGSASAAPAASNAPAQTAAPITSIGKPTTLASTTLVSSVQSVLSTTDKDGKASFSTSHFQSTIVTAPVVTPSSVITPTGSSGSSPTSADSGAAADQQKASHGLSTGGKAAIGVMVPLIAIAGGAGLAFYLLRKRNTDNDNTDNEKAKTGGPVGGSAPQDPRERFAAMPVIDSENPDHEPLNGPTLPKLRTPQMSMVGGPKSLMSGGTASRAGAAVASAFRSTRNSTPRAPTNVQRTTSVQSDISSVSAYSRHSDGDGARSVSPIPPLPEIPQQQTSLLDSTSFGSGIGMASSAPSHPFDRRDDGPSTTFSFPGDNAVQKAPSPPVINVYSSTSPEPKRISTLSVSDDPNTDTKHLSTASAISDAPTADARATQLYYPFGDTVMTPGGRIVPRPVGPNPNNINPGLGGLRPDGSRSASSNPGSHTARALAALNAAGTLNQSYNGNSNNANGSNAAPKLPQITIPSTILSNVREEAEPREASQGKASLDQKRASSPVVGLGDGGDNVPVLPSVTQDTGFSFDFDTSSLSISPEPPEDDDDDDDEGAMPAALNSKRRSQSLSLSPPQSPTFLTAVGNSRPSTSPDPAAVAAYTGGSGGRAALASSPSPPPALPPPNIPVERSGPGMRPRAPSGGRKGGYRRYTPNNL